MRLINTLLKALVCAEVAWAMLVCALLALAFVLWVSAKNPATRECVRIGSMTTAVDCR